MILHTTQALVDYLARELGDPDGELTCRKPCSIGMMLGAALIMISTVESVRKLSSMAGELLFRANLHTLQLVS